MDASNTGEMEVHLQQHWLCSWWLWVFIMYFYIYVLFFMFGCHSTTLYRNIWHILWKVYEQVIFYQLKMAF